MAIYIIPVNLDFLNQPTPWGLPSREHLTGSNICWCCSFLLRGMLGFCVFWADFMTCWPRTLRSVQSFLALRVDEVACRLLLAQVRCIFLTFSIRGQLWTTTTISLRLLRMLAPRGSSALSVLLIDRRLAYSPIGAGAVLRSLLRKSSVYHALSDACRM